MPAGAGGAGAASCLQADQFRTTAVMPDLKSSPGPVLDPKSGSGPNVTTRVNSGGGGNNLGTSQKVWLQPGVLDPTKSSGSSQEYWILVVSMCLFAYVCFYLMLKSLSEEGPPKVRASTPLLVRL